MRLYLSTTPNIQVVPFNYQRQLTGVVHKWFGESNLEHGTMSLYSFSWLNQSKLERNGLMFPQGAKWFISFYDERLLKRTIKGVMDDPEMFDGMRVNDILIDEDPELASRDVFRVASPVFIKRTLPSGKALHYTYEDPEAGDLMTATLQNKLKMAGLEEDESLKVSFDVSYANRKIKLMEYDGVRNKASLCPVFIHGTPETKRFAWNVGVGNSTGIGFGSIY